jgi:CHAT domain-containing protein/Tfp pilus assembly protein PilF
MKRLKNATGHNDHRISVKAQLRRRSFKPKHWKKVMAPEQSKKERVLTSDADMAIKTLPKTGMNQKQILTSAFFVLVVIFSPSWLRDRSARSIHQRSPSETMDILLSEGDIQYREGYYRRALKIYQTCLDISQKRENGRLEVDCLNRLGLIFWNIGQMEESYSCLTRAVAAARRLSWWAKVQEGMALVEIFRLYTRGKELRAENRHEESLRAFAKAIEISREWESPEFELKCLRQFSLTHWELFRIPEFHVSSLRVLELARVLRHRREEAKALINIGLYHQKVEDYSKALIHYKRALEISRKIGDRTDEAASLNNIGILYRRIGDFERSLQHLKQALSLDRELENEMFISQDMNNIGTTFRQHSLSTGNQDLLQEALRCYQESLEMARKAQDIKTEIEVLNNIGVVYTLCDNFDRALRCFHSAIGLTDRFPYLEARCMALNNMAGVYLKMGVLLEAEKIYEEAIELGRLIERGYILWEAYYGLGQCYERVGKIEPAMDCYSQALTYVDLIRNRISLDAFKAGFSRDKIEIYEALINLLFSSGWSRASSSLESEIFDVIERAKARAFLESLGESRVDVLKRLGQDLAKQERELTSQISHCVQRLSEPGLSRPQRQQLHSMMLQSEEEYLILLSRIRAENPNVFSLLEPQPIHLEKVQSELLDDRTAIVEYFLGEAASYGLVIREAQAEIFPLPDRQEIVRMLRAYLKILSEPPAGSFKGNPAARRLYDVFFAPADAALPAAIENVIIIPDGILYYLPFETLVSPGEKHKTKGFPLIQRFTISYAPSCSSLFSLIKRKKRDSGPLSLLAFGSPAIGADSSRAQDPFFPFGITGQLYTSQGFKMAALPHSSKEVRRIARLFEKRNSRVYLGRKASEEAFKNCPLQDFTLIHFACHGFLDENSPFRSALVLSQDQISEEDGFLQVREIYNLRVEAEMVVLSACQTASGTMESGEGVLGLPRIFFYTGARTVLTSLWRIQDKTTARFMTCFYKNLVNGCAKAQALRLAKLEMIQSRFSHPYYWAAFVLNGDWSSRVAVK